MDTYIMPWNVDPKRHVIRNASGAGWNDIMANWSSGGGPGTKQQVDVHDGATFRPVNGQIWPGDFGQERFIRNGAGLWLPLDVQNPRMRLLHIDGALAADNSLVIPNVVPDFPITGNMQQWVWCMNWGPAGVASTSISSAVAGSGVYDTTFSVEWTNSFTVGASNANVSLHKGWNPSGRPNAYDYRITNVGGSAAPTRRAIWIAAIYPPNSWTWREHVPNVAYNNGSGSNVGPVSIGHGIGDPFIAWQCHTLFSVGGTANGTITSAPDTVGGWGLQTYKDGEIAVAFRAWDIDATPASPNYDISGSCAGTFHNILTMNLLSYDAPV